MHGELNKMLENSLTGLPRGRKRVIMAYIEALVGRAQEEIMENTSVLLSTAPEKPMSIVEMVTYMNLELHRLREDAIKRGNQRRAEAIKATTEYKAGTDPAFPASSKKAAEVGRAVEVFNDRQYLGTADWQIVMFGDASRVMSPSHVFCYTNIDAITIANRLNGYWELLEQENRDLRESRGMTYAEADGGLGC